jgi:hypothetical protein
MIFIEGTTFRTKPVLFLFTKKGYEPIGNAVSIINTLHDKGNKIFLCSYVRKKRYHFIQSIMDYYGVKYNEILCRDKGEQYSDLVENACPDILIEDDCRSIGGEKEWCITNVHKEIKRNIQSIIVKEYSGIDQINLN